MRKTGIFGGSFNPIHNGHIRLARRFLREAELDEVWLMVSPQNPLKVNEELLDDQRRLEMVSLALQKEKNIIASDYEFRLPKPSYTWHTLQKLSLDYPEREFVLLIGGDNWVEFDRWFEHDKILKNYRIAVYPRHDAQINAASLPANVMLLKASRIHVSSTEVRRRISQHEPIDHLVPPVVAAKIIQEGYYQSTNKAI